MARGGPRRRRGAARCPRSFSLHRGAGGAAASPRTPALLLALLARSFWARRTHPSARRQPDGGDGGDCCCCCLGRRHNCQVPVSRAQWLGHSCREHQIRRPLHAPTCTPRAPTRTHALHCHDTRHFIIILLFILKFCMYFVRRPVRTVREGPVRVPSTYRTPAPRRTAQHSRWVGGLRALSRRAPPARLLFAAALHRPRGLETGVGACAHRGVGGCSGSSADVVFLRRRLGVLDL